ncbi:hypothetical protein ACX5I6_18320 [Arthrobacter sp. MMS24-T111]
MAPSAPVLRTVSTTATAAVMALAFGIFPTGPAAAATPQPSPTQASGTQTTPDCGLLCLPVLASSPDTGQTGRPRKSKDPVPPPAQPAPPPAEAPVQPPQPAGPPAATAPQADASVPPADAEAANDGAATAVQSADAAYRPPTGPSSGKDWNSPVTRSAAPTQLAAVSPARGEGPGGPALLPIALGTVLLAVAAGAFAWWNRNRLRSH